MKTPICLQAVALAIALSSGMAMASDATPPSFGASLETLLEWSETHSPMISAMQAETEAKRQQVVMARSLDDPSFGIEWRDIDSSNPTLNPTQVGSMRYTISQMLPLWGKRDIKGRIAEANVGQAEQGVLVTRADVRQQIRLAYADRYRALATQAINHDIERLLQQMDLAARQRYQIGQAGQSDIIRLQTELSMLRNEQLILTGTANRATARLAALLNVPVETITADPANLPLPPTDFHAADWLSKAVAINPDLAGSRKSIESAQGQRDLAGLNRRPGVEIGVSAIQMESRLTMYELMLKVDIPLQRASKNAERAEATAMLNRARAQEEAQLRMVEREINEMAAMLATARAQTELLDKTLTPQADLSFQSTLASYQNGKGEFASLLEAQQQIRRLRQMRLMADIDQFQAWTGLLKLAGDQ